MVEVRGPLEILRDGVGRTRKRCPYCREALSASGGSYNRHVEGCESRWDCPDCHRSFSARAGGAARHRAHCKVRRRTQLAAISGARTQANAARSALLLASGIGTLQWLRDCSLDDRCSAWEVGALDPALVAVRSALASPGVASAIGAALITLPWLADWLHRRFSRRLMEQLETAEAAHH